MKERKKLSHLLFIIFLAIIFSGILGEIIKLLPDSPFRRAFLNSIFEISIGMKPINNLDTIVDLTTAQPVIVNLGFFAFKFGFIFQFNFITFLSILLAVYLYKLYRH